MSCKSPLNNSTKNSSCDSNHWARAPSTDINVKFAGEEAKDRMYEPKHKQKLVRVLTVIAYIFFVSLAAIMLSLYYVFIWKGSQKEYYRPRSFVVTLPTKCVHVAIPTQSPETFLKESSKNLLQLDLQENATHKSTNSNNIPIPKYFEFSKRNALFNKLFRIHRREKVII